MWYGTDDSTIHSFQLLKPKPSIIETNDFFIEGLPHMTDYHMMNNKRYLLTNNSASECQLWELDSAKMVNTFVQPFKEA